MNIILIPSLCTKKFWDTNTWQAGIVMIQRNPEAGPLVKYHVGGVVSDARLHCSKEVAIHVCFILGI